MILIKYNLPQYLFHAIRYSSDVILHFHHLGCFDTVFIHTENALRKQVGFQDRKKEISLVRILHLFTWILSQVFLNLRQFF